MIQCHILSTEMVALFMAFVCICGWRKTFRKDTFIQLLQAVGLTILVNAWFLVPFLYMFANDSYNLSYLPKVNIGTRGLWLGEMLQFLPQNKEMPLNIWGHVPAQIGVGVVMLLLVYLVWHFKTKAGNRTCNVYAFLSVLALVLCMGFLPWKEMVNLPVISFVVGSLQFPWRFMSIAAVCSAMFAAHMWLCVKERGGSLIKITVGIATGFVLLSALYYTNSVIYEEEAAYLYEEENIGTMAVVGAEYLLQGDKSDAYFYHLPVADEKLNWSCYDKNGTNVDIILSNQTKETLYIELPLIGYKGYRVDSEWTEDGPYITEERGAHGDLRLAVPPGYEGMTEVSYKGFLIFHIAEAVSVVTVVIVLAWFFYSNRKRMRNEV